MDIPSDLIDSHRFTDADLARIDAYRRKWNSLARSVQPVERITAEHVICQIYASAGLPSPNIVWCQSPWQIIVLTSMLPTLSINDNWSKVQNYILERSDSTLWKSLWHCAIAQQHLLASRDIAAVTRRECPPTSSRSLLPSLWRVNPDLNLAPFSPNFRPNQSVDAKGVIWEFTPDCRLKQGAYAVTTNPNYPGKQILLGQNDAYRLRISNLLDSKLSDDCSFGTEALLATDLVNISCTFDPKKECCHGPRAVKKQNLWWGPWLSSYQPLYDYLLEEYKRDSFDPSTRHDYRLWLLLAECATTCLFFEDLCLAGERPIRISLNEHYELHDEHGPALMFADGFCLYSWRNWTVPEKVVEDPNSITIFEIDGERNVEIRRIMIEVFGTEKYITESGAEQIHQDAFGVLYRRDFDSDEPFVAVKVLNRTLDSDGTHREFFLRVPPHITTAKAAVAWTFGMNEAEYNPEIET